MDDLVFNFLVLILTVFIRENYELLKKNVNGIIAMTVATSSF